MKIGFGINCVPDYSPIKNKEQLRELTGIEDVDKHLDFHLNNTKLNNDWFYCSDLFNYPQINWNGEFKGCCIALFNTPLFNINFIVA